MYIKILNRLKKITPNIITHILVVIIFKLSNGKKYTENVNKIIDSEDWDEEQLESFIIHKFNAIFQHSKKNKFYKEKYKKSKVYDLEIKSLEDIKKVPILTREEIRTHFSSFSGTIKQSTSGTTGHPLNLYLDKDVWSRERAHIYHIRSKANYKYTDPIFTFRDCDKNEEFIRYNYKENEYFVNIYKIFKLTDDDLNKFFNVLEKNKVKYLYGYPSAIKDFLCELEKKASIEKQAKLKKQIVCCFLGSEYPTPNVVLCLERWGLNFISWYGHSEVCVLAETHNNKLEYFPYYTYGLAEIENNMLIGTSYHNYDMPLIRYNTNDHVAPIKHYSNGILKSFEINGGRIGDVIVDQNNFRIPITSMLVVIREEVYDLLEYIQMYQTEIGKVTILITQSEFYKFNEIKEMELEKYDVIFDFIYIKEPVRTKSGKILLKVKDISNLKKHKNETNI